MEYTGKTKKFTLEEILAAKNIQLKPGEVWALIVPKKGKKINLAEAKFRILTADNELIRRNINNLFKFKGRSFISKEDLGPANDFLTHKLREGGRQNSELFTISEALLAEVLDRFGKEKKQIKYYSNVSAEISANNGVNYKFILEESIENKMYI